MFDKCTVQPYTPSLKASWDELVDSSINGTFIHKRDFIEYHRDRFKECSLIFFYHEKPIAVFPAEHAANQVFSYRGLTFAGWIIRGDLEIWHLENIIKDTLQYYSSNGFESLEIRTVPEFFCLGSLSALEATIKKNKPELVNKSIFHITTLPFLILDRGRKWGIKKAHSLGLKVEESIDFDGFWQKILEPHLLKKYQNKPIHSLEEIQYLKSRFQENIKLFVVFQEDEMVAGTVLFLHKTVVHCQYIGSIFKGRKNRALDLLFGVILDNYNADKSYLSLGTSLDAFTGKPIPTLIKWKESLGAVGIEVGVWRWSFE